LEGRPFEPGGVLEGHPAEPGVLEGRPLKTNCFERRVIFRVVRCRGKNLIEERHGDWHATRVDLGGFAELLERRVPLLTRGVGQALETCSKADANAAVFVACWLPLDAVLVPHAPPASSGLPDR
jgi:hypothetical protein